MLLSLSILFFCKMRRKYDPALLSLCVLCFLMCALSLFAFKFELLSIKSFNLLVLLI